MGQRVNKALGRLLNQFQDGTNLPALLEALVTRLEDTDIVLEGLLLERTIDTAEGVWLDQVGDIVGYARPPKQKDDSFVFTLKSIGDPDVDAQALSSLSDMDGGYLSGIDGIPLDEDATDTDYRNWVKGKVRATYTDATIPAIFQFVDFVFGTGTCSNVSNLAIGQVGIELATTLTRAERLVLETLAPRSAGVSIEITNWP